MSATPQASPTTTATPECIGSQTVGPYYAIGLDYRVTETLAPAGTPGRRAILEGTLFDADGVPVPDAILELWQASADGQYVQQPFADSHSFTGFARLSTHNDGRFRVETVIPGAVSYIDGRMQSPHIVVLVFMRGLMRHLVTRVYFPGFDADTLDPVLQLVPQERRATLLAHAAVIGNGDAESLHWDIHLQGERETVFFAC